MQRRATIAGIVALVAVVALSIPGAALLPTPEDEMPSAVEMMKRAGWVGVKVLAEVHDVVVASGKLGKKGKATLIVGGPAKMPSELGPKPKGKLTVAIRPFHSFLETYQVTATVKKGTYTEATVHIVRGTIAGPKGICTLAGSKSGSPAPPKCGSSGGETVGIAPVDGTEVPTFDVTRSYSGVVTKLSKGECIPKGKPMHPAPKAIRWELPLDGMCRSIGAGKVTRPGSMTADDLGF